MTRVAVLGATTWGLTLGLVLSRAGIAVTVLTRTEQETRELHEGHLTPRLPRQHSLPDQLTLSSQIESSIRGAEMLVLAVPCHSFRENLRRLARALGHSSPVVVSASKGLEPITLQRMSQVMAQELPERYHERLCALSGPNLAMEIVEGKPASTVVASTSGEAAAQAQEILSISTFRVYTSQDVVGVEMGGALKNIIALAAGISDGLGYGNNGKAALIARGLAEITRLGVACDADPLTFSGLAGLGDLVATCTSPLSRNWQVGQQLGRGAHLSQVLAHMNHVAEGVYTTPAAVKLADRLGVEMPITRLTNQVLYHGLEPRQAAAELMGRPLRHELEGLR